MKNLLLTLFTIVTFTTVSVSQSYQWAKSFGGTEGDQGTSVAVDINGNIYTTGFFSDTADFDPGPLVYNLISKGNDDIFISKTDSGGNLIWATGIGSSNMDRSFAITCDDSGNVYATGSFRLAADFDPDTTTAFVGSFGLGDIFVVKLNTNGNFVWAKHFGGNLTDEGLAIAVDLNGNVYSTGTFQVTADFDPDTSNFTLTSAGNEAVYISKLDKDGNFVWAKRIDGTDHDYGYAIDVDANENVIITGVFRNTVDFDPGVGIYNLTSTATNASVNTFIVKLNGIGDFVWAKKFGGISASIYGKSLTVDASGNVYTTGHFGGIVDFDPGTPVYYLISLSGVGDIFVSKLDTNGNFVWAKQLGGLLTDEATCLTLDYLGNVYITGMFNNTADFDPDSVSTFNMTSWNSNNGFITMLDINGDFVWAKQFGGPGQSPAGALAVDLSGSVYATGYYNSTCSFDYPTAGNLTYEGGTDVFLVKFSQTLTSNIETNELSNIYSYPNPTTGILNLKGVSNEQILIYNNLGELILKSQSKSGIDLSSYNSGIYLLQIIDRSGKSIHTSKILKW